METTIKFTANVNPDFISLIALLDADLNARYGLLQKFFDAHNGLQDIRDVVVVYLGGEPVACGAFKAINNEIVELKRIFVKPEYRNRGLATQVVRALEERACALGYTVVVLETGIKQAEAIALYQKLGYAVTENYGPYVGNENSVCMGKGL
jgi:putative acetyltransferase